MYQAIGADIEAAAEGMLESGFVMAGGPEDCVPVLDAFKEVGVDQVIIHMQMGAVPHEQIMESIDLMGRELLPRYR